MRREDPPPRMGLNFMSGKMMLQVGQFMRALDMCIHIQLLILFMWILGHKDLPGSGMRTHHNRLVQLGVWMGDSRMFLLLQKRLFFHVQTQKMASPIAATTMSRHSSDADLVDIDIGCQGHGCNEVAADILVVFVEFIRCVIVEGDDQRHLLRIGALEPG